MAVIRVAIATVAIVMMGAGHVLLKKMLRHGLSSKLRSVERRRQGAMWHFTHSSKEVSSDEGAPTEDRTACIPDGFLLANAPFALEILVRVDPTA